MLRTETVVPEMLEVLKEKYGAVNINILKRELLLKSKTMQIDDWLVDVKMLRNDIKLQDIPQIIKKSIEDYNHKIGIGV